MEKEHEYKIDEQGRYVYHFANEEFIAGNSVAIAFDPELGVIHKHGKPELVNKRALLLRKTIPSLVVIEGRFPLDELNRCLLICDYVKRFYNKLQAGEFNNA
jgi:hypothetical protein